MSQPSVSDQAEAEVKDGHQELSRVAVSLYKGRWESAFDSSNAGNKVNKFTVAPVGTVHEGAVK